MTKTNAEVAEQRMQLLHSVGNVEFRREYQYVGEVGTPERHSEDIPGTFSSVLLPFSAEEWLSIAQNEGDHYVGGCCGNMSALQDDIEHVFRFGGGVDNSAMADIAYWAKGHDGFDLFEPMDDNTFKVNVKKFPFLDPWEKIGVIYNAVESVLKLGKSEPFRNRDDDDLHPGQAALSDLSHALFHLSFHDMFTVDEKDVDRHTAQRNLNLARVYPLTKRLLEFFEQTNIDFGGYAIIDENNALVNNGLGPCIYMSEQEAQRIVDLMEPVKPRDGLPAMTLTIVPCTVTRDDGLVLGRDNAEDQ